MSNGSCVQYQNLVCQFSTAWLEGRRESLQSGMQDFEIVLELFGNTFSENNHIAFTKIVSKQREFTKTAQNWAFGIYGYLRQNLKIP